MLVELLTKRKDEELYFIKLEELKAPEIKVKTPKINVGKLNILDKILEKIEI